MAPEPRVISAAQDRYLTMVIMTMDGSPPQVCGICGSPQSFRPFAQSRGADQVSTKIFFCKECGVLFNAASGAGSDSRNSITDFQMGAIRGVYQAPDNLDQLRDRVDAANPILDTLFEQAPALHRHVYYEVGAGAGLLAAAATRHFDKVYANDLDTSQIERTFSRLELTNAHVLADGQPSVEAPDVIVLWHVLEHLLEPFAMLEQLANRLAPEGAIFAQVPCYRKEYLYRAHIWFFSEYAVRMIGERLGFKNIILLPDTDLDFLAILFLNRG